MLPPFIIDQIRQREEEETRPEQPVLELPLPAPAPAPEEHRSDDEPERGVVIIDLASGS